MTATVTAYFDLDSTGGVFFTLDDPVKGRLDNVTYKLAGPIASDLTPYVLGVHIQRGRQQELVDIPAGVATVQALNTTRLFDPDFASATGALLGDEAGVQLVDETGAELVGDGVVLTSAGFGGNIAPGRRIVIASNGVTVFDGNVDNWAYSYDVDGMSTVTFDVVDALATLASKEFDAWTTTAGDSPGERLTAILDRPEVAFPPAARNLAMGLSDLQADNVSWGSNVLNYAQLVAKSEIGFLFASRDNVLTFYGRDRQYSGWLAPVFADDYGAGIVYNQIARAQGTQNLYNRVGVDRAGGIQQTVTDVGSMTSYGPRSLSVTGLLLDSDTQSLALANLLLAKYKQPTTQFATVTALVQAQPAGAQYRLTALDIGDVCRVKFTPNGIPPAIDKFCLVQGRTDDIGPIFHTITFSLSFLADVPTGDLFILDDPVFGRLDHAVLAF